MIPIIQHPDRAISARDYAIYDTTILVTSTFSTIQGEGPFAGYPAMFVRLAGCNYGDKTDHCQFCDTYFSYEWGSLFTPAELLDKLLKTEGYSKNQILVITGGEPTLQKNLLAFIVLASSHFQDIQIETNGTQPKFFDEASNRAMMHLFKTVVSPKANVRLGKYGKVPDEVLWWASCLKFVVTSDETNPHHTVPDWALATHKPVYISPMAIYKKAYEGEVSSIWDDNLIDREATSKNYNYAAKYVQQLASQFKVRLSVQMHLFVSIA